MTATTPPVEWVQRGERGLAEAWATRRQRSIWRADPVAWAQARGIELWSGQREILIAAAEHDRVAVRSCHNAGKSFGMSVLVAWWLDTHEPGTARVVSTAPTGDQVRGVLWVEINAMWDRLGLPGRRNQTEIWYGTYQAAVGRKSSDYNPAAFSGWHAPHLLVIVDEADGVSTNLWGGVDTLATNVGAKIIGIGNPDDPQSEFRRRQADQDMGGAYHTVKISAWDTPNFSGERVSPLLQQVLLAPSWVEEMRRAWGGDRYALPGTPGWAPDHPFWSSKVEAEYPDEAANTVIRLADLLRARRFERDGALAARDNLRAVTLGIDVAGSDHGDESVARGMRGLRLLSQHTVQTGDPEELEDWLVDQLDDFAAGEVHIDADGVGFGYSGALRRRRPRVAIAAVRSSAAAKDAKSYLNARAEMWWQLREALAKTGDDQLDFTQIDDATAGQLLLPRYGQKKGRIQIESKDDLRKRMGRSPDNADAVVYVVARPRGGGTATLHRPRGSLTGRSATLRSRSTR